MSWSPQQDAALCAIRDWHRDSDDQVFYLGGYAGTGKTTIAKEAASSVSQHALFAAFTGKAALVLQSKGCTSASTIHSLIYKAYEHEVLDEATGEVLRVEWRYGLDPFSAVTTADLVVIDECSMVGDRLGEDLLSFGTKVLVLGDPAQLPPVRGEGFFTRVAPDFMLTEIHRQAADNPIIRMSMDVREGRRLGRGAYGDSRVIDVGGLGQRMVTGADQVLVGRNQTRRTVNAKIRRLQGRDAARPEPGDRLVCLKNNKDKALLNGGLWSVREIEEAEGDFFALKVESCDVRGLSASVRVHRLYFDGRAEDVPYPIAKISDAFTYGYALTVHKAQGSQWDDVLLIDESSTFRQDRARHLYTGLTRAAERVTVVLS
ncbi:ATP-dependent DNA helicase [Methylobacterium soli]|uniref:AAA family ATPase n=1 Tax=Methylobacterium soli TaxID=553447 RepID=A0A6L3T097_9HYPH|nr:AAA family ATPase [Methylobacterium soli]KAB1079345.1 AAA family ATPase [Methylobacterium soli]GJE41284.1 ATP-dependent RecD-like DNA helicase [Methylobacterium soli]